jgi:murein L,D-transpeptidase YcbB/YkuD
MKVERHNAGETRIICTMMVAMLMLSTSSEPALARDRTPTAPTSPGGARAEVEPAPTDAGEPDDDTVEAAPSDGGDPDASKTPTDAPPVEPAPRPPFEAEDKAALARLGALLPRHGVLPISPPRESASDGEWTRYGRRLVNVFAPASLKPVARTRLLETRPLAPAIEALIPRHRRYVALTEMLALYARRMDQAVAPLPETPYTIRVGVTAPEVGLLRDRLRVEGYGDEGVSGRLRDYFDDRLKRALQSWQKDKKLPPTIVLDPLTRRRLNDPVEQPVAEVALALARFRALDLRSDEGVQLLVHVNNYELVVERDGRGELAMPVVVGKNTDRDQTPMLSAPLYAIVVNPSWHVPTRLVDERLRPEVKDVPELLIDKGYEVSVDPKTGRWRVRMGPGPENPLGKLKFLLAETQSIYLHDTPQRNAFGKDARALSAGCVRLSDPTALARYLLSEKALALDEALAYHRTTTTLSLTAIPTHLAYQTVLVEDGRLVRFPDIYERDAADLAKHDAAAIAKALAPLLSARPANGSMRTVTRPAAP